MTRNGTKHVRSGHQTNASQAALGGAKTTNAQTLSSTASRIR